MNKNYDYKRLTPFKWFVLQNFPFIDEDFDAITNYQLFCKLGEEINKIIDSQNIVGEQAETLTNAFNNLKNYVDNYFENLDVQEEINNKLDEMVQDGTLQEIIATYLQINGVLAFNTLDDLKKATNLIDGSICKTLGKNNYLDGEGSFYKIRNLTTSDIVDNINIIPLDTSNILIAEKIPNKLQNDVNLIKNDVNLIKNDVNLIKNKKYIFIGDSYALDRRPNINITGWAVALKDLMGLVENTNCWIGQDNGGGFIKDTGTYGTFLQTLQNHIEPQITNKDEITDIIVCGGLNDCGQKITDINTAISNFMSYVKQNYINATVYIGHIGNESDDLSNNYSGQTLRYYCLVNSIPAYQDCVKYGAKYLNGVEYVMKDYSNYYDRSHPNQTLCNKLAQSILQSYLTGYVNTNYVEHNPTINATDLTTTILPFAEKFINNKLVLVNYPEYENNIDYSTAKTITGTQLIIGDVTFNYYRPVYPYVSIMPILGEFIKTDNTTVSFSGNFEIYYHEGHNYLVLNFTTNVKTPITDVIRIRLKSTINSLEGLIC